MKQWFRITPSGVVTPLPDFKAGLKDLQQEVGGYVEHVTLDGRTELWVNEEGKIHGLPYNHRATQVWELFYGRTDLIVGTALVSFSGKPSKVGTVALGLLTSKEAA